MRRREFLSFTGRAALGLAAASPLGWLTGCGEQSASESSLQALRRSMRGRVILREDGAFATARLPYNPRFDLPRPLAVAYPIDAEDVATALAWARDHAVRFTARCGGHSYAGYSTSDGLVIDLGAISTVAVNVDDGVAVVGAGARLIDAYAAVGADNLGLAAGSCPTVGISGLTLGGGLGLISRCYGLTSDNLLQLTLVTADGAVRRCDAANETDLFWACRGGGGGNFGIATSFAFRVHPIARVAYFRIAYPWSAAARVVESFDALVQSGPDELMTICKLARPAQADGSPPPEPLVVVLGQYVGSEDEMREVIAPLLDPALGTPTATSFDSGSFLDASRYWAGCEDLSIAQCHRRGRLPGTTPDGVLARVAYKAKSQFYDAPLDRDGIATAMAWIEARSDDPRLRGEGALQIDAWGGALNRVAADATAFVHRRAHTHGQFLAGWRADDPPDVAIANLEWIGAFYADMQPFASGEAYQNYIDPDLADWPRAYYGTNLERLMAIKQRVDPDGVFDFAQGIPRLG
ncbi:MAG: FAD-binding oxidoreductase [Deltaproteobacteria bacterium]|nr:FAD-binding oxidoreductase [Deltaproteobacteria bacterium]